MGHQKLRLVLNALLWTLLHVAYTQANQDISAEERDVPILARQNYQFTGALAIYGSDGSTYQGSQNGGGGGSGSPAVQAQCPADHPVSCSAIQQPYYCCPSNNYCAWSNSVVSCCPNGQTCYAAGANWQPTTTWAPAPTTVYVGGGGYVAPAATTVAYNGGYCSTLVAVGPNLPTTGAGECGTILIVAADAIEAAVLGWARLALMVLGLQALGGLLFLQR